MFVWETLAQSIKLPDLVMALNRRMRALSVLLHGVRKEGTTLIFQGDIQPDGSLCLKVLNVTPSAPPADTAVVYATLSGGGKVQIMARYPTGAPQLVSSEP